MGVTTLQVTCVVFCQIFGTDLARPYLYPPDEPADISKCKYNNFIPPKMYVSAWCSAIATPH